MTERDYGNYADAGFVASEEAKAGMQARLFEVAQELLNTEREVERKLNDYKSASTRLYNIQEGDLPKLMEELGCTSFTHVDRVTGVKTTIDYDTGWRVNAPAKTGPNPDPDYEKKHEEIRSWLVDIGQKGLIRHAIDVNLGLMSEDRVAMAVAQIKHDNPKLDVKVSKSVNHSSLAALVRRMKEKGENVHQYIKVTPIKRALVSTK